MQLLTDGELMRRQAQRQKQLLMYPTATLEKMCKLNALSTSSPRKSEDARRLWLLNKLLYRNWVLELALDVARLPLTPEGDFARVHWMLRDHFETGSAPPTESQWREKFEPR